MLKLTAIVSILFALLGSCNEERFVMSAEAEEVQKNTGDAISEPTPTPTPLQVTSEENPAPKQWPQCWLSARLSTMTAFRITGFGGNTRQDPLYESSGGRQEFKSTSYNPTTDGNCVLNWYGQDNSKEPWVSQLETKAPNMHAALTCIADKTPDCRCVTLIPSPPYTDQGIELMSGVCVREVTGGGYEIYNVRDPSSSNTVPAAGKCDAALADSLASVQTQATFMEENTDTTSTGANGSTCRTDIEPFAPLDDEKGWYANKIRDWAITTCTDTTTNCRCYVTYHKSGHKDKERSLARGYKTCLLCADGTCQQAVLSN